MQDQFDSWQNELFRDEYTREELSALLESTRRALNIKSLPLDSRLLPSVKRLWFSPKNGDVCMNLMGDLYRVIDNNYAKHSTIKLSACLTHCLQDDISKVVVELLYPIPPIVFAKHINIHYKRELENLVVNHKLNHFVDTRTDAVFTVGGLYVYSDEFAEYLLYKTTSSCTKTIT